MKLVPLFNNNRKIEHERLMLERKSQNKLPRIELFFEANSVSSSDGNWIPQNEYGQEWDARLGKWVNCKSI